MELSKRLETIGSMVNNCRRIVDVGTDHGYIPIYLVKKGICEKVIASDINKGPVEKAAANIKNEGLSSKIECRLGSGLSTVSPGEVDCAVIAGMGGNLIRDIINESMDTYKALNYAILQPVQNAEVLRRYIYESGFNILDEELCFDEGKYYEIIKVQFNCEPKVLEDIFYEISPVLISKNHQLLGEFINYKLMKYEKIVEAINEDTNLAMARKNEANRKIGRIKELLSCL